MCSAVRDFSDKEKRFIILRRILYTIRVTIVGIYAPNTQQAAFGGKIFPVIFDGPQYTTLTLGDFNMVLDVNVDQSMRTRMSGQSLVDIWWLKNENVWDYTIFLHVIKPTLELISL